MATASVPPDITSELLVALSNHDSIRTDETFPAATFSDLKSVLDRLSSKSVIRYEQTEYEQVLLEPEGEEVAAHGSHEARVFEAVRQALEGLTIQELESAIGDKTVAKLGQGKAFKEKWISKAKNGKFVALATSISDHTQNRLRAIQATQTGDAQVVADLKKRKLVRIQKSWTFTVSKGPSFTLELPKEETELTVEMIHSGSYVTANFKPYNFKALGALQRPGALHPLNKVRQAFRQIFFEMGFTEMPTNNYVDSGFWNFDALFVPQQHPARDLQDTFYTSDPKKADRPRKDPAVTGGFGPETYWDNVKAVHQDGKYGSIGYRYPWSADESLRLVLRTHTTAASVTMLYKLAARNGPDGRPPPARYFSIDRVFRNEQVDATHLAEFHQVEGVIADYGLTLGGLMEFMGIFFGKMGLTDLKFKPAYNPYTEPSLEIFAFHHGLNKLVEIGNSGMFRPEMLRSMGLPEDMRVFGWGLSLERPTMIKYGISNIRDLLGHKVDLNMIARTPAVRLDKD